jgi:hypothetical protein
VDNPSGDLLEAGIAGAMLLWWWGLIDYSWMNQQLTCFSVSIFQFCDELNSL